MASGIVRKFHRIDGIGRWRSRCTMLRCEQLSALKAGAMAPLTAGEDRLVLVPVGVAQVCGHHKDDCTNPEE
jgi:hypothetical protein